MNNQTPLELVRPDDKELNHCMAVTVGGWTYTDPRDWWRSDAPLVGGYSPWRHPEHGDSEDCPDYINSAGLLDPHIQPNGDVHIWATVMECIPIGMTFRVADLNEFVTCHSRWLSRAVVIAILESRNIDIAGFVTDLRNRSSTAR
jgi:hypothetical protein